ncbi:hypothetical protein [Desulfuribacillus alkaliarsenatis]|uniref:Uncharacterized protein n=1 Tax=Desulfuribacillus alkaliarsenatis TaxID=766136 RepID=A0A1E5G4Z9_9FIRM|nr:hypothetical protein [Desulfuribacillus alkaliarsenatis]OEF98262.1 hypothetical protein BHF68_00830 [Desulfuribacillus alkaliarsenatis]
MKALVVLNPSMSKRLIGRAVANMSTVQTAYKEGRIIIAGGTTNAYVAEELLQESLHKGYYTAGIVSKGKLDITDEQKRLKPISLVDGEKVEQPWPDVMAEFTKGDLFIKGASALDLDGNVGILAADQRGGTIGLAYGTVIARGATFICPVGLEKLVPNVIDASIEVGINEVDLVMGTPVGLIPLSNAIVITELEAFEILFDVMATHVASGGANGSEGSVTIVLEGEEEQVRAAFAYVESIQNESNVVLD